MNIEFKQSLREEIQASKILEVLLEITEQLDLIGKSLEKLVTKECCPPYYTGSSVPMYTPNWNTTSQINGLPSKDSGGSSN